MNYFKAFVAAFLVLCIVIPAFPGGPLLIGNTDDTFAPGQPFAWSTASEIQYHIDGGGLGTMSNASARTRVQELFQVWEDVTTSSIGYNFAGGISNTFAGSDGDITTATEYGRVNCGGSGESQNAIIFDANGSLFTALGLSAGVIGFAGPCSFTATGTITSGRAALNGRFQDGIDSGSNFELSEDEFDAAFIHEFGHFSGLDHSQINNLCGRFGACVTGDSQGLPTMFPLAADGEMKSLSEDDKAWISQLYPSASFSSNYGTVKGEVLFSQGTAGAQGVNVIARKVGSSRSFAVSAVSGYLFSPLPCQSVTGTCPGVSFYINGGTDAALDGYYELSLPPGDYLIEVESVDSFWSGGSSVGPLDPVIPMPGDAPALIPVTVTAGSDQTVNIILENTDPTYDDHESSGAPVVPASYLAIPEETRRVFEADAVVREVA